MASLEVNINQVNSDFQKIKEALVDSGVEIPSGTRTSEYGNKIRGLASSNTEAGVNADSIIDRSITEVSGNATLIGNSAFYGCTELTIVNFPLATKIGNSAFYGCSKLTTVNTPLVANIGQQAFTNCTSIKSVSFPLVTFINSSAFYECGALETAEFTKEMIVSSYSFRRCYSLKAVILRSQTMCDLVANSAFLECTHILGTTDATHNPNGLKDGYIYVPRSLVDSYKAHKYWSAYESQFRALEDYTVDGTTTGALDNTKI